MTHGIIHQNISHQRSANSITAGLRPGMITYMRGQTQQQRRRRRREFKRYLHEKHSHIAAGGGKSNVIRMGFKSY
jgi:hypothetical protein